MNKIFKYLSFSLVLFLSGCHMLRTPAEPSRLSVDAAATEQMDTARDFANTFASEKNGEGKTPEAPKPAAKPKKETKIKDPAWQSIQKQKAKTEKKYTLTELIDIGLKNNPKTRKAWEDIRVARAVEKQDESALYPQVNISQSLTKAKQISSLALAGPGKLSYTYYGPSAELTYLLLDFGGRGSRIESTFQKVLEANSQYNQSLQDLIRDVQKAYYSYYASIAQVEAEGLDVQNTKTSYDFAQAKFDVGMVPKLDVLQAKSNYENSLFNLESAKGEEKTAKANLALAIGVAADTDFDVIAPAKEIPTQVNEDNVTRLIEEAILKRPDLSALRAELKSKKAAAKAALSDVLPSISANASASNTKTKYSIPNDLKDNQNEYSGGITVNWDVFDGFNNWNKKKQADYEAKVAFDSLVQAELEASSDVWVKYYDFNTAVEKFKFSQAYYDTTNNSYEIALESYKAGLKSMLDLIAAQSSLSLARSRLIRSKEDVFIALAELAHSTGTPNIKLSLSNKVSGTRGD